MYKIIEACSILFNMILSITCVSLSCIYLTQFHSILDYLKEINVLNSQLFIYYPFFYVCCEIASFLLDLVRLFGTAQVAKLFHYENKQKRLIERKITRTDDFLISQAQNNKTMHIILNLKLRNKMRKKFKQLFTHLIWIEILINIYFMVFVIANKISAASYLKLSLLNEFTLDSTKLIQANSMFECCQISDSSNSTQLVCLNNQEELDCLHDNIDFYLNMIVTLFFSTSLFKLIVQVVFIVNLKVILIDDFIMKHMSREENLSKQYETFQAYLFTQSVQERIEYNAKEMANNLEKLKGQRTSSKRKKTTEKGDFFFIFISVILNILCS